MIAGNLHGFKIKRICPVAYIENNPTVICIIDEFFDLTVCINHPIRLAIISMRQDISCTHRLQNIFEFRRIGPDMHHNRQMSEQSRI